MSPVRFTMKLQLCWLVFLLSGAVSGFPTEVINTEYGRIRGNRVHVQTANTDVISFHAVPFGKPANGTRRFAVSQNFTVHCIFCWSLNHQTSVFTKLC